MTSESPADVLPAASANRNNRQVQQRLELTKEEIAVLKECNRESFWYRCVPLSCVLMGMTQLGVNRGILRGHPVYGALYKNIGAAFVGYFAGKISYHKRCREKLSRIPGSKLGASFNKSWKDYIPGASDTDTQNIDPINPAQNFNSGDDYSSNMELDADPQGQNLNELDDSFRPTIDREFGQSPQQSVQPSQSYVSYEDLQNRNRSGYQDRIQKNNTTLPSSRQTYSNPPPNGDVDRQRSATSSQYGQSRSSSESKGAKKYTTNTYGDVFEE